ncbi:hypothetical protein ACIQXD_14235 [Streptomyces uncialis]|uniref:hypothetical protein n=1 Tax=Streptomyces uncialis TaxID=1048205 RepID=UPI0038209DA0
MAKKTFRVLGIVTSLNKPEKGVYELVNAETPEEAKRIAKRRTEKKYPDGKAHMRDAELSES